MVAIVLSSMLCWLSDTRTANGMLHLALNWLDTCNGRSTRGVLVTYHPDCHVEDDRGTGG